MRHFVHPHGGRLFVAYMLPGTDVASAVADFPETARAVAQVLADRLTRETAPAPMLPPPAERRIPAGFYADTGALF